MQVTSEKQRQDIRYFIGNKCKWEDSGAHLSSTELAVRGNPEFYTQQNYLSETKVK